MLRIHNAMKVFNRGSINEIAAFKNIDLHLSSGEFLTVIGTNGSGKSSILNAIAGLYNIDQGSIILDEIDMTRSLAHKRAKFVSRVFQNPFAGTASFMTLEENLRLAELRDKRKTAIFGLNSNARKRYQDALVSLKMDLENRLSHQMNSFSGGQRQAITLLMATLLKPKILLLDEHTAALDPLATEQIINITHSIIRTQKITTMMVTHSVHHAINYGDTLIMMDKGKIIWRVEREEKKTLTKEKIFSKFQELNISLNV